jgi:hypothetical protein
MAEVTLDLRRGPKDRAYALLHSRLIAVLAGIEGEITAMATMGSLLYHAFRTPEDRLLYRVVSPNLLRVGPHQGTVIAWRSPSAAASAALRRPKDVR